MYVVPMECPRFASPPAVQISQRDLDDVVDALQSRRRCQDGGGDALACGADERVTLTSLGAMTPPAPGFALMAKTVNTAVTPATATKRTHTTSWWSGWASTGLDAVSVWLP